MGSWLSTTQAAIARDHENGRLTVLQAASLQLLGDPLTRVPGTPVKRQKAEVEHEAATDRPGS
jgi:hypothetical protein